MHCDKRHHNASYKFTFVATWCCYRKWKHLWDLFRGGSLLACLLVTRGHSFWNASHYSKTEPVQKAACQSLRRSSERAVLQHCCSVESFKETPDGFQKPERLVPWIGDRHFSFFAPVEMWWGQMTGCLMTDSVRQKASVWQSRTRMSSSSKCLRLSACLSVHPPRLSPKM